MNPSLEGRSRPSGIGTNEKATLIPLYQIIPKVKRLRVLDVEPQRGFASGEVTVQFVAIVYELIAFERHYGIYFADVRILYSTFTTIRYHRIGDIVLHIAIKAHSGYRKSHNLRHESVRVAGAVSKESHAEAWLLRSVQFLRFGSVDF